MNHVDDIIQSVLSALALIQEHPRRTEPDFERLFESLDEEAWDLLDQLNEEVS